jgi:putative lipoprotein
MSKGDKIDFLATLETLNPRCNVDGNLEFKQKDTKIIAIK